jgi:hypothetical protein
MFQTATINPDSWAYHSDFADMIVTKDRVVALRLLATADIALSFARSLVAKEFVAAAEMLADSLKTSFPPNKLREELEKMIRLDEDAAGWPTWVQVVTATDHSDMRSWRRRAADDFGWAYVAINGADYCEAVAVVIAKAGERLAIREIEWGRP